MTQLPLILVTLLSVATTLGFVFGYQLALSTIPSDQRQAYQLEQDETQSRFLSPR